MTDNKLLYEKKTAPDLIDLISDKPKNLYIHPLQQIAYMSFRITTTTST